MKREYWYKTCCIECDDCVDDLNRMIEEAVPITYRTMRRHCGGLDTWAINHGYELHHTRGLTLKSDWHVGYFKSSFKGRPCYYLVWSAIEFIWTQGVGCECETAVHQMAPPQRDGAHPRR